MYNTLERAEHQIFLLYVFFLHCNKNMAYIPFKSYRRNLKIYFTKSQSRIAPLQVRFVHTTLFSQLQLLRDYCYLFSSTFRFKKNNLKKILNKIQKMYSIMLYRQSCRLSKLQNVTKLQSVKVAECQSCRMSKL